MKKQFFAIGLIVLIIAGSLTGCKKGSEDPFLSLRSRKARLTGVWNLSGADYSVIGKNTTETYNFDNPTSIMQYTYQASILNFSENYKYSRVLTINSDDTFTDVETESSDGLKTTTIIGYWYFAPAVSDLDIKNKERVVFQITRVDVNNNGTNTFDIYDGPSNTYLDLIDLEQLSNKQITITLNYTRTDENGLKSSISGIEVYTHE